MNYELYELYELLRLISPPKFLALPRTQGEKQLPCKPFYTCDT